MSNRIPEKELLDELERLAEELGRSPTTEDMKKQGEYSVVTYISRFNGWNDSLEEAGLTPTTNHNIPSPTLLAELRRLVDETGKLPTRSMMDNKGKFCAATYTRRFDSWDDALREADLLM